MLAQLTAVLFALFQTPFASRAEIDVDTIAALGTSPNGDVWTLSRDGRAWVSQDQGEGWTEVMLPKRRPESLGSTPDELLHIDFFDERHGVISGSIGGDAPCVLRTEDAGATWRSVLLPRGQANPMFAPVRSALTNVTVTATSLSPDGTLWLATDSDQLFVSRDRGATFVEKPGRVDVTALAFESCLRGVAGTQGGALSLTQDGAATWVALPSVPAEVDAVVLHGDRVVVLTEERARVLDVGSNHAWVGDLEIEGQALCRLDGTAEGLVGVAADGRIARFSSDHSVRSVAAAQLAELPWKMSAGSKVSVLAANGDGPITVWAETGVRTSHMLTTAVAKCWPLRAFDATSCARWFGIGRHGLYASIDEGKSWKLRAIADDFESVQAFADGSGALVRRDDRTASWDESTETFTDVEPLARLDSWFIVNRRGSLWIGAGHRDGRHPTNPAIAPGPHTVLVGPEFTTLVFGSVDGGRTWTRILEVEGSTPRATFFGDDDVLSLLLTDSNVLRAQVRVEDAGTEHARVSTVSTSIQRTWVSDFPTWGGWIEFVDDPRGSFGGFHFHGQFVSQATWDAGYTWRKLQPTRENSWDEPWYSFARLSGGTWTRVKWRQTPNDVSAWRDGEFRVLRTFGSDIHDAHVDASGRLLVRLEDSAVWTLSGDGKEWKRLADQVVMSR